MHKRSVKFPLHLDKNARSKSLLIARGEEPADTLLKNAKILDLVNGAIIHTNIALSDQWIAGVHTDYTKGHTIIDLEGRFVAPGFIDSHVHVESSLMHPFEFERMTLHHGTTTAIVDPHEITNVLGSKGFEWILRCAPHMRQNFFVQVSSCVPPVEGLETNGGVFTVEQMKYFKTHPHVLGLAEMMNVAGVVNGDSKVLEKLDAFDDMILDGHAPMVRGMDLNAYRLCGIQNCHESVSPDEAVEKLQYGMSVILREGSAAKNIDNLASIVSDYNAHMCLLCSDDRNPLDIKEEGHIDYMVRRLIQKYGIPPLTAYKMSSYSAAKHFGLKRLGLIAPGYHADFLILSDIENVIIDEIYCKGTPITDITEQRSRSLFQKSQPPLSNSIHRKSIQPTDLDIILERGVYRIIRLMEGQLTTEEHHVYFNGENFKLQRPNPDITNQDISINDILPINVVERYGKNIPPAKGLVSGFQFQRGAIATSIAHDCHNLIVVGKSAYDRAVAINYLIDCGGGMVAVENGRVVASLPLPIAGLMSDEPNEIITLKLSRLREAATSFGCTLSEPYLQMAFLALPVIPHLKLTDKGLIQYKNFQPVDLLVNTDDFI